MRGITLTEVLVGIGIIGLLTITVGSFQQDVFSLNKILQTSLTSQQEAKEALKAITSEIREASFSSAGAYPIADASLNSFVFFSDIDNDGQRERIRYFLDGAIFKKGTIKPSGNPLTYNAVDEGIVSVVKNISNEAVPIFEYYNSAAQLLTQPVNRNLVRLVKVTLIIDDNPTKPPAPITVTTQVSIRNLKDNL